MSLLLDNLECHKPIQIDITMDGYHAISFGANECPDSLMAATENVTGVPPEQKVSI